MKPTPASLRALTFVAVFSVMLIPIIGEAKFMRGESVPVDRLIHNLEVVVKGEPNNIEATYTLGRLHSLAFAEGSKDVEMYTHSFEDKSLLKTPLFAPYSTPKQVQDAEGKKNPKSALFHLSETLRLYRKSIVTPLLIFVASCLSAWSTERSLEASLHFSVSISHR